MKREFLQNIRVGEQSLPKEVIDAIMAENGQDIEATRALFADYDSLKQQLATAQQTIHTLEENAAKALEDKVRQMEFSFMLQQQVGQFGGRNQKAVEALLDLPGLQQAEDPKASTQEALKKLQKENPWLFQAATPPPYASGTGAVSPGTNKPDSLAGALRERFDLRQTM